MKGKIFSTFFIIALFIFVDFIFFNLNIHFGIRLRFSIIDFLINSVLIFLLLENFIYKKLFNLKSSKFKIAIFIIVPLIISMHITDRFQSINKFYLYSKAPSKTTSGNLWKFDYLLAHKAIPNSHGSYYYYIGDSIKGSIPVIFDSIGYRTVSDSLKLKSKILDLYLGCSFTFGDYIEAQYGYPYLTSKLLGHNYINAGASAYGFGQMIQIVDSLTRKYQFKYVFIQLSPWLSERTMTLNGPTFYGYRPFPYFSDDENSFKLNPTSYSTFMYSQKNWCDTKPSYFEKIHFFFSDGIKVEICDYYSYQIARLKMIIGLLPKPTKRKADLERYFYKSTIDLCKKNNAVPIILKLRYPSDKCKNLLEYLSDKAQIIDLDFDLERKVVETGVPYEKLFSIYHFYGKDSIIYDGHPNKLANKLFSISILNKLKKE